MIEWDGRPGGGRSRRGIIIAVLVWRQRDKEQMKRTISDVEERGRETWICFQDAVGREQVLIGADTSPKI